MGDEIPDGIGLSDKDREELERALEELNWSWGRFIERAKEEARVQMQMKLDEYDYPPDGDYECMVCGSSYDRDYMEGHHTSYDPEERVLVCRDCHNKIHHKDGFRDDLIPDDSATDGNNLTYSDISGLEGAP